MKERKVKISIGFKLITIISVIIIVVSASMITLASYWFRKDTVNTIRSTNLEKTILISRKIKSDITAMIDKATIIAASFQAPGDSDLGQENYSKELSKLFMSKDKNLIYLTVAEKKNNKLDFTLESVNSTVSEALPGFTIPFARKIIQNEFDIVKNAFDGLTVVTNISNNFNAPVLTIAIPYGASGNNKTKSILLFMVRVDELMKTVESGDISKTIVVNSNGNVILHHNRNEMIKVISFKENPLVKAMITSTRGNKQIQYSDKKNGRTIGTFVKVPIGQLGVINTVQKDKALEAVDKVQRTNILVALIAVNIAILIVYFFAKTLVNPIKRLVGATQEIEKGNYDLEIKAASSDEVGLLTNSFLQMGQGLGEREKMKVAFGKFVNKEIVELVLQDKIKLGGERKETAIFFSDIRSFTAISEKLEPEEVVEFLNAYMTRMVKCVNETNGTVDKFIGDAIMALWGVPLSHGNDTENAITGALMMRQELIEFNQDRGSAKKPVIQIGSGINTGPVLAGQIGSEDRMEYTVIGDAVNLASRIEGLNKPFGTDILISQDSYNHVKGIFKVKAMDKIKVKGKVKAQQVYAVLGRADDPHCPKNLKELRALVGIDFKKSKKSNPDSKEKKYEIIK